MKAVAVLYAARLSTEALSPLTDGLSAFDLCLRKVAAFPDIAKIVLLARTSLPIAASPVLTETLISNDWDKHNTLNELASKAKDFDFVYFAWADCPLLDPMLATAVLARHQRFAAEYSFADGWPNGFAPEILAPSTAAMLAALVGADRGRVERDLLFSVIQKDINAFDIETELSKVDLRGYRLNFYADCRRNRLLVERFLAGGFRSADDTVRFVRERPEALRTLPAFFAIQVAGPCPQACDLCPYPRVSGDQTSILDRRDFMDLDRFTALLDGITGFAGDAVIDFSLWGELSLHPQAVALVESVLSRPALAAVVETSGVGWASGSLERLAAVASDAAPRINGLDPLNWIVSLDSDDEERYRAVRGPGFTEAQAFAERCLKLFPRGTYVQAVRVKGAEADLERFYRNWKAKAANVIVQKFDNYCGVLPDLKASDLSPLKRPVCWHLLRDVNILLDGTVPLCKEDLGRTMVLGNVFTDSLDAIWSRGASPCGDHIDENYSGICRECDEYYTYTF